MELLHTIHIPATKHLRSLYYRSGLVPLAQASPTPIDSSPPRSIARTRGEQRRILLVAGLIDGALARADQPESRPPAARVVIVGPQGAGVGGDVEESLSDRQRRVTCAVGIRENPSKDVGVARYHVPERRDPAVQRYLDAAAAFLSHLNCACGPRIGRRAAAVEGSDRLIHQDILFFRSK